MHHLITSTHHYLPAITLIPERLLIRHQILASLILHCGYSCVKVLWDQGVSDHAPLVINIPKFAQRFPSYKETIHKRSDAETQFFTNVLSGINSLNVLQLNSAENIELACN